MGLGMLGGGAAYVIDWGASYAPVAPTWQAVITGLGGGLAAVLVARYGNSAFGSGIAGGTGAMLVGRVREIVALMGTAKPATKTEGAKGVFGGGGAGRVYRERDAAAVYREAGALVEKMGAVRGGGRAARSMPATSFKEAGRSRYIQGPVRWFGPRSWAYGPGSARGAGVVYRSAHNTY